MPTLYLRTFDTMDVLSSLPRDTAHVRQLLFNLPLPFSLNRANYDLFWPLIDNVYSIRKTRHITSESCDFIRHNVICRFKRAYNVAPSSSLGPRAGNTKRASQSCDVAFRMIEYDDHVEFHVTGDQLTIHDHSLDESVANKRNSLLRGLLQHDISKGYAPAAVIGSVRGNGQSEVRTRLIAAGGAYLSH